MWYLELYYPEYKNVVPAYTFYDLLSALPQYIEIQDKLYELKVDKESVWYVNYEGNEVNHILQEFDSRESLCNAAYEMLCWCTKQKYVK